METFAAVIIVIILLYWMGSRKPNKFPPGPHRWPLIGNILDFIKWGTTPLKTMQEIYRRYGEISGFFIGNKPVVLISGLVPIHEISKREDLAGRFVNPYKMFNVKGELYGITSTSGEKWKEHREFAVKHLGNGQKYLEEIVCSEISTTFKELIHTPDGKVESKPVSVKEFLELGILNILLTLIIGKRYDYSDSTLKKLMHHIKKMISLSDYSGGLFAVLPLDQHTVFSSSKLSRIEHLYNWFQYFFQEEYKKHKKDFRGNTERDFMDAYLNEVMNQKNDADSTFTEIQLVSTCFEFLVAGTTTTYNTLEFALLYMARHQEIQQKVQEELDKVIGSKRLPRLKDRSKLPYIEATLLEVFRKSSVLPLSVPHACWKSSGDVKYRDYIIPKEAQIILNIYGVHHDSHVWLDPKNFRPERFLNDEGKIVSHDGLMPFGIGKRVCVGEAIARDILLLLFSALMQRYSIHIPKYGSVPSEESKGNFLLEPKGFCVEMVSRIGKK